MTNTELKAGIEDNWLGAFEQLHQMRIAEQDEGQQKILQRIEMSLCECRHKATIDKRFATIATNIIRSVSTSRTAREVANKINEYLSTEPVSGEVQLRILDVSTSSLSSADKELAKIKGIAQRLSKEKEQLKKEYQRIKLWVIFLIVCGVIWWMLTR